MRKDNREVDLKNFLGEIKKQDHKTNHILHLILTILTGGIWLIVWILVVFNNNIKRSEIDAEYNDKITFLYVLNVGVKIILGLAVVGTITILILHQYGLI